MKVIGVHWATTFVIACNAKHRRQNGSTKAHGVCRSGAKKIGRGPTVCCNARDVPQAYYQ